jgi:Phage tail tube protein
MAYGIGGGGFIGIAHEVTVGTYVAPTKYFPIMNETLKFGQATNYRRPIRQSADIIGAVAGDSSIDGDISMEAFEEVVPYFLYCARAGVVKSGAGPFTYVFTGNANAVSNRTMSITVIRNGAVFGYVGCSVTSFDFAVTDETLMFNCHIMGLDEASQSLPTSSFPNTETDFGAGTYSVQIPTATQVFDTDVFDLNVDDSGTPQFRLKNTGRAASFISYGERTVKLTLDRDFQTRTDYDAFKALTAQAITILASKGATSIQLDLGVAFKDDYPINLSGEGELLRASLTYMGAINSSGVAYTVTVITNENIT